MQVIIKAHGDSCILANATSCTIKFSRRVLEAIDTGTEDNLLMPQKQRIDAIKCSQWPMLIKNLSCCLKTLGLSLFPQNAVTLANHDIERNTCLIHANVRRLTKRLSQEIQTDPRLTTLPPSCRDIACNARYPSPTVSSIQPTTWNVDCITGICTNCPGLQIALP